MKSIFEKESYDVNNIPFRRHEKWIWVATWILPVGLAVPAFTNPSIALLYYTFAIVCVVGLLLTMRDFFIKGQ